MRGGSSSCSACWPVLPSCPVPSRPVPERVLLQHHAAHLLVRPQEDEPPDTNEGHPRDTAGEKPEKKARLSYSASLEPVIVKTL